MTAAERSVQNLLRQLDHLLHRELLVAAFESGDDGEQRPLPVGGARPAPGEEVHVELPFDFDGGNGRLFSLVDPLDERVVHLPADELDEVRIASGHLHDLRDRPVAEPHRARGVFDGFADGVLAVARVQALQEHDPEHPLGERPGGHQLGEQRREAGQDEHQGEALPLQRLEGVEQEGQRVLLLRRLVRKILRLVTGEDDAPHPGRPRQRAPGRFENALDLVERQAGNAGIGIGQGLVVERTHDGLSTGRESGPANFFGSHDYARSDRRQVRAEAHRHVVLADAGRLRQVGSHP